MVTELERIAVLETKSTATEDRLVSIESKLDDLLTLKSKGMGAIGLVSLLIGSGVLGLVITAISFFTNRSHL